MYGVFPVNTSYKNDMVHFIGAGPGDPELLTLKGKKLIDQADVIIYAGSLVNKEVLAGAKEGAKIYNSATMTLEEVIDVMKEADARGLDVARVHTGDPAIFGAHREQMDELDRLGIAHEVIPGVSSFLATAAERVYAAGSFTDSDSDQNGRKNTNASERKTERSGET